MLSQLINIPSFVRGQPVVWPPAPDGLAQIDRVGRSRVRLVYRAGTGLLRRPLVDARALAVIQKYAREPPLPLFNPFGRAILKTPIRSLYVQADRQNQQSQAS